MTIVVYIVVVGAILVLCALGLSIGLLLRNKGLTPCGRGGPTIGGEQISCPSCGKAGTEACDRRKKDAAADPH